MLDFLGFFGIPIVIFVLAVIFAIKRWNRDEYQDDVDSMTEAEFLEWLDWQYPLDQPNNDPPVCL